MSSAVQKKKTEHEIPAKSRQTNSLKTENMRISLSM